MLSTSTLNLGDLPNDIALLISRELSIKNLCYFGSTSRRWYQFFHTDDALVWREYYERHFGKLKNNIDIKEQTIAASLYHEANSARRADDKQRLYCHLFDYLTPFRQKPSKTKNWTLPYFIRMYGHGYGIRQDTKIAANYLRQSFRNNCPKAAVLLAELLEYPQLGKSFKKETKNIMALLEASYQSSEYDAAKQLGNFYRCLIGYKEFYKNAFEGARKWYLQYYDHGFDEGLDSFMRIQMFDLFNLKVHKKDKKISAKSIRKKLLKYQNTHPNSAIIAFYLATINQFLGNEETAITEFERAATLNPLCHRSREHLHAYYLREICILLQENSNDSKKTEADLRKKLNYWHRETVRTGEVKFLYMSKIDKKIEDDLEDIKVAVVQNGILTQTSTFNVFYPEHVYSSMSVLSDYYIASWKSSDKTKSLVWLAFLSQCGCDHATDMIFNQILNDERNAYLLFAKGLIELYGIITHINEEKRPYFTEGRSPNREQALKHFHKAQVLRPTILVDYLNIAENEHPLLMSEGLKQSLQKIWKTEIVAEPEQDKVELLEQKLSPSKKVII